MDFAVHEEALSQKDREYYKIEEIGADILCSDKFRRIVGQRHHIFSTVGYHSVHVAQKMLFFSRFINLNERDIVRASLWHDVGIYDRDSFNGSRDTAHEHPVRSLDAARQSGTLTDTQADMIANHMWPVTPKRPRTMEGLLITVADKWCAVTEFLNFHDARIDDVLQSTNRGGADALD